ncbi:NADH:ubiquinone oxidoreductase 15 kDa subunit-like precursor [Haematococcus lacustris]
MASMGLQGGTARCYDWFMDLLKCLDESKAPTMTLRKRECEEWRQDYFECLHHQKEDTKRNLVEREYRRQKEAASAS